MIGTKQVISRRISANLKIKSLLAGFLFLNHYLEWCDVTIVNFKMVENLSASWTLNSKMRTLAHWPAPGNSRNKNVVSRLPKETEGSKCLIKPRSTHWLLAREIWQSNPGSRFHNEANRIWFTTVTSWLHSIPPTLLASSKHLAATFQRHKEFVTKTGSSSANSLRPGDSESYWN